MLDAWVAGVEGLLQVRELMFLSLGMGIGLIFGALPGLGGATALALLMPLTYGLEPFTAVALAGGVMGAVPMGGSLTAILLNSPGSAPCRSWRCCRSPSSWCCCSDRRNSFCCRSSPS